MFTGIIRFQGSVLSADAHDDLRLGIRSPELAGAGLVIGESIAVNGVCLTVAELVREGFVADVSTETLGVTTLGQLRPGDAVNLEPALAVGERLGGHFVSGHVDGIGSVRSVGRDARSLRIEIELPPPLLRYVSRKGSICVDGVSLTINSVSGQRIGLNIIPHTAAVTNIGRYATGTQVNIEVDLLARYLERLLDGSAGDGGGITTDFLKAHGYA